MRPPYLQKGDKIAIIATARKITKEEVQPAIDILRQWGLEVILGNNLFSQCHQFAGSDEERSYDLQTALDDISVKAIIVARGGYGTVRIIDGIDFEQFKKHPKWVIGYSDITVLHAHIHTMGIETLHASMPINFLKNAEAIESLRKALWGEALHYKDPYHPLNKTGSANAPLVGGNLSILYSILASPSDLDTTGKILFIEDLDEYLYHVDRMIMALKRAGKLAHLKGLIVGGMTDMRDNTVPYGKTAEEIVSEHVKDYHYPVCFQFPAGHIDKNMALFLGQDTLLDITEQDTSLTFTR